MIYSNINIIKNSMSLKKNNQYYNNGCMIGYTDDNFNFINTSTCDNYNEFYTLLNYNNSYIKLSDRSQYYKDNKYLRYKLLPWVRMKEGFDMSKFCACYLYKDQFYIPRSFILNKNKSKNNLNSIFEIQGLFTNISSYLSFRDLLNFSETCIDTLDKVRKNSQLNIWANNTNNCNKNNKEIVTFCKQGIKNSKKYFELKGENINYLEYQLWWFCSFTVYLNKLWEKWENFVYEEEKTSEYMRINYDDDYSYRNFFGNYEDYEEYSDNEEGFF